MALLGLAFKHFGPDTGEHSMAIEPADDPLALTKRKSRDEAHRAVTLLRRFERYNDIDALHAATDGAQKAFALDPDSLHALYANGLIHDAKAEYDKARELFARMRQIAPASSLGYVSAANTYVPEGNLGNALHWLQLAQAAAPGDVDFSGGLVLLNDCLEDYVAAQQWSDWLDKRVTNQPQVMALQARHHYLTGNFESSVQTSNIALKLDLARDWYADAIFMRIKRDEALAEGMPQPGIDLFSQRHAALFASKPEITPANIAQAVDLAYLLKLAGQQDRAIQLSHEAIQAYEEPWFLSGSARAWLMPVRAEALAILGDQNAALEELKRIVDAGWRIHWRWETEMNPNFTDIRNHPAFRDLVRRLEADMAEQRLASLAVNNQIDPTHQRTAASFGVSK